MRAYELMVIFSPVLDEEKTEAAIEKVKGIIEKNNGAVDKVDKWGMRKLAYEIKDFKEGFYSLIYFKGEAGLTEELDRLLKISDEVIKHLIIRIEE